MIKINRRKLLKVTSTGLIASTPLGFAGELLASQNLGHHPLVFFDKNFPLAHNLVKDLVGESIDVIPIEQDITDYWINELKEKSENEALQISGVTTESLFVCLRQLLERENLTKSEISRVDKDLFMWKIYSNPKLT